MRAYLHKFALLCLALPMLVSPGTGQARSGDMHLGPSAAAGTPVSRAGTPQGLWRTANGDAIIQIAPCGNGLCGAIVGLFLAPNEPMPKDWAGATQCRLTIIRAAPQTDDAGQPYWAGQIVNPRDGTAYNATLRVTAQNQLLLRGYVLLPILGETQTWTAYHGKLAENCRL